MKISYLIRTNSLNTDDRFNKTHRFLVDAGAECDIFAVVKSRSDGFSLDSQPMLWSRKHLPDGRFITLKYLEMLLRSSAYLLMSWTQRRWFANFDFLPLHALSVAFSRSRNRPIWDLHEMPPAAVARNPVLRGIFSWLLRRSDVIVCNEARRAALEENFGVDLSGALILRNLPDIRTFKRLRHARKRHLDTVEAAADARTVVILGGASPGRYVEESLEVLAELQSGPLPDLKTRIIGGNVADPLPSFVQATGRIPFAELVEQSVTGSVSLCFYDLRSLNNLYCEPNRFFQALVAGQHVISFIHSSLAGFDYPWHRKITQDDFRAELRAALVEILSDKESASARLSWAETVDHPALTFDSQYPAFLRWLRRERTETPSIARQGEPS